MPSNSEKTVNPTEPVVATGDTGLSDGVEVCASAAPSRQDRRGEMDAPATPSGGVVEADVTTCGGAHESNEEGGGVAEDVDCVHDEGSADTKTATPSTMRRAPRQA